MKELLRSLVLATKNSQLFAQSQQPQQSQPCPCPPRSASVDDDNDNDPPEARRQRRNYRQTNYFRGKTHARFDCGCESSDDGFDYCRMAPDGKAKGKAKAKAKANAKAKERVKGINDTLSSQSAFVPSNKKQAPPREMSTAELTLLEIQNQSRSGTLRPGEASRVVAEGVTQMAVPDKARPRLLLMGQRRSGKSSISSVVFHKLPPQETLFLESTARIQNDKMTSFMDIQVWDFPGQLDIFSDPEFDQDAIFGEVGALIWVIDAQDDYLEAVERLNHTILNLYVSYPHINVEVFIHKVDGLSDDYRLDIQRDIVIRVQDELSDQGIEAAPVNFHMTSIYNHSIFEAFSKVIQKLIPRLGTLEAMLTNLCRTCHFEKAYLFDVTSKIYIATDSSPADMPSYEICSDFIDVILDITEVFGAWKRPAENIKRLEGAAWAEGAPAKLEDQVAFGGAESCLVLHESNRPIMLREVDKHLALVAIMEEDAYEKMPLVTMNVETIAKGLQQFFEITKKK